MAESTATDDGGYAVELIGITKRFPGVVANDDIHLRVRSGEVHALCGENGAGKSTLMKILYGMQQPDEGTIRVDGADVSFRSPADAIRVGIGMVHQHFMLADNLTVAENVLLGAEAAHGIGARARARIAELGRTVGLRAEPGMLLERLGVADRQRVEILKVLYRGARTVILDEPTAVLVPQEVDELFATLRGMQAEGYTFLFISHKLDEVRAIADSITVIRRGTSVGTADPRTITSRELAEMMVGSELPDPGTGESTVTDREVLRVEGLTLAAEEGRPLLAEVDLVVHAGEVLGIAGVEGNGQTELVETIMGMRHATAGRIVLGGRDLSRAGTLARREAGIGYIPKTARGTACWPRSRGGRTGSSAPRPVRRSPGPARGGCSTSPRRAATPSGSSPSSTCAPRGWTCLPPRCRAATSRSSSSAASCRAIRCCSSRRTRRAGWTSARRPASGRSCARRGPPGSRCC